MAFEADCGSSTVLEALRVASTARPLVPEEGHEPRAGDGASLRPKGAMN
jgi:hypothetical protein